MALLLAVTAGNVVRIARLIAVSSHMVGGAAVAASPRLVLDVRTVFGEMTHYVTATTLNIISIARFGTVLGVMALLMTILALMGIDTLLGTVAGTVTLLLTVNASDCGNRLLALDHFLLAMLADMAKLCT
jgi:hypothetical protein